MAKADLRLDLGFLEHHKTIRLQRELGEAGVLALLRLWIFTARNKPTGDLAGLDAECLAVAAGWNEDANRFVGALVRLKFLDEGPDGYIVHDWAIHQPFIAHSEERTAKARASAAVRWGGKRTGCETHSEPQCETHKDRNAPSPTPTPSPDPDPRSSSRRRFAAEDMALAERFRDGILANKPDAKVPKTLERWADEFRLMRERDHRKPERTAQVIDWAQTDSFWRANILSPGKLREQYDKLEMQMSRKPAGRPEGQGQGSKPKPWRAYERPADEFARALEAKAARDAALTAEEIRRSQEEG